MTIDQLLALLVVVTFVNVALLIAIWRGGPLTDRWAWLASSRAGSGEGAAPLPLSGAGAGSAAALAAPAPLSSAAIGSIAAASPTPAAGAAPAAAATPTRAAGFEPISGTRPRLDSLPTDLAELLSRPAAVAPPDDVAFRSGDKSVQPILASWMPHLSHTASSSGLTLDSLTNLEGPASWSRILEIENARLLRYRRAITVVMAELEGVRRLADRVGQDAVDRLLPVVADAFRKEARGSDWIARIGEARFAALMTETDEIQAINYVERVRLCCEPWLASAAVPMRLAIGWASPPASGDLEFAVRRAEERMHADRRVPGKGLVPVRNPGPRVVSLPARPGGDVEPPAEAAAAGGEVAPDTDALADAEPEPTHKPRHRRPERS